jgi:hypothetical protein
MALTLHNFIDKYNPLQLPTDQIYNYLQKHPNFYKTALLANHIFRAVSMTAFNLLLPFSTPANIAICFAGSLFYRLTVETHCAYKFALPAFAGALAFPMAYKAILDLIQGAAFVSINVFAASLAQTLPLAAYFTYIVLTVDYDVDARCGNLP